jgi:uncharacterized protein YodC (DUF2158 family)
MYPAPKFKIGQIVRVKSETDPDMLAVVDGLKLAFFDHMRRHIWYVYITDRISEYREAFDEDELEIAEAQTEDQKHLITGGHVPIRPMTNCWHCGLGRIDDEYDCPYCSADYESDNGMDDKASAIEIAQSLNIDTAIRVVAKSGKNHDRGPNWYAEWNEMAISATFGAGTNSASVSVVSKNWEKNSLLLYNASDYGRHIETFRKGPWVERVLNHANKLRQDNEVKAQERKDRESARQLDNFREVDF